jgi:hypothetical protein
MKDDSDARSKELADEGMSCGNNKNNLRQSMMTQEFKAVANQALAEALPLSWIRIWDNLGGKVYFYYNEP